MDLQTGANGRGPLGTGTNSPVSDAGTLARTQNRANVTQGTSLEPSGTGSGRSNLTDADRDFIRQIHRAKNLDGTPMSLDQLLYLRSQNVHMQEEARRELGPNSTTVSWFNEVIAAYDEEIAKAKSPVGSAVNALKTVLADPNAREKDMQEKLTPLVQRLHDDAVAGIQNDDLHQEGLRLIGQVVERVGEQRTKALEDLNRREKASPGSVTDEQYRVAVPATMGGERQKQMLGINSDEDKPNRAMQAVIEALHLVSERRLNNLKALIAQEKKSPGSIPEQKLKELAVAVVGDDRQSLLLGISDDQSGGLQVVIEVMALILKRRKAAVDDLIKSQSAPGSGVTNDLINQAIQDYNTFAEQARRLGMAVPAGNFTLGTPQIDQE
jgi:hypothetical protein